MIQLTPTLLGFEAQNNSYGYRIVKNTLEWFKTTGGTFCYRNLPEGNEYELLGTYSPDGIDFDCESYIAPILDGMYLSYMDLMGNRTKEGSFRSLLTSKGCDLTKKYVIIKSKQ